MRRLIALVAAVAATAELRVERVGEVGFRVDNGLLLADHSPRGGIDSGTLHGLVFQPFGLRLERTFNNNWLHWAPSFQRPGERAYTSISSWSPVQQHAQRRDGRAAVFTREGRHAKFPEIRIRTEYRYEPDAPYFHFRSELTVEKAMDMLWLRNQEMTMDAFFTHAAWPGADGKPVVLDFEARKPVLEKSPLRADLPWIAFINLDKGYGFGAVVFEYTATRTANPMVSINDGAQNGKYWDRRVINQQATRLEPGDRFTEQTAYVLFRVRPGQPVAEFLEWEKKLRARPLKR